MGDKVMAKVKANQRNQTAGKVEGHREAEAGTKAKSPEVDDSGNLLTQEQAAEFLNMKPSTLTTWRALRKGPKYSKFGRSVRYRRSDLVEFVSGRVVEPLVEMN
jgi:predicted DNA-binding transcriptional regulator AlpA